MTQDQTAPREGDRHPTYPLRTWCERCSDWISGSHWHCAHCFQPSGPFGHHDGKAWYCPQKPEPLPPLKPTRACPRGCQGADDCKASIAIPCPLARYDTDDSGKFQPCGCLERSRCKGCGTCINCSGCFCGED